VAAPDHKIEQCIQRSALFPGRADGRTECPERDAGSGAIKRLSAEWIGSGDIRGSGGYAPRKICKNQLLNRVFSAILKWPHPQCWNLERLLIKH